MGDELMQPRSATTDKRYYGVAGGTVVDNLDPEKMGRVKVKFPWFDEGMDSEWCQVVNLYAGSGYGSFFVPEVGDSVLVAFEFGDMRKPFVLGGLYNDKALPPTARESGKDQKMIRTKGQHEFLLDDTPGKESVRLKTNGGHTVQLDDVAKTVTVKTASGQEVTMEDSGGKVSIKTSGGQSITMDASGIKLTATNITLSGTSISLGEGAAMPLVLGTALLAAFNTHIHPTAVGPSGPPVVPLTPAVLSKVTKTN
ncbi:MAG TPA: phage baseplate assembly protein V [Pyrinomonadaceae bacterium]|nr:phage baseplate assembly protein V [Pyrinomonadaceae bacterium]